MALVKTEEEREWIREQVIEVPSSEVTDSEYTTIKKQLEEVPPAQFDVARQVRVYSAYLQYVELKLSGAAIQRHRFTIPRSIQKLGGSKDLAGIEKGSNLSSKQLEKELNEIKNNFTPSLGKIHGRVLLKAQKANFEKRIESFEVKLEGYQKKLTAELQSHLDESFRQIAEYFLPRVLQSPPDSMLGQLLYTNPTDKDGRQWLEAELRRVFPKAETLIGKMQLDTHYKDVTFETLSRDDFLSLVRDAFPMVDWDKAHNEFRAAGERDEQRGR